MPLQVEVSALIKLATDPDCYGIQVVSIVVSEDKKSATPKWNKHVPCDKCKHVLSQNRCRYLAKMYGVTMMRG
jgi:hypothetical protein